MAIDLSKVEREAPHLVNLVKETQEVSRAISLKKGLNPADNKAAVVATFDCSGSAQDLYRSGEIQGVADQAFAAGLVFDDDGEVPVSFFDNRAWDLGDINLGNCKGFIAKQRPNWGGTSYVAALNWIIDQANYDHIDLFPERHPRRPRQEPSQGLLGKLFGHRPAQPEPEPELQHGLTVKATAAYPTFAIFVTDGEPQDPYEATELLIRMSQLPIFVQFVGVGRHSFQYLKELNDLDGRYIDNAGFFDAKDARGDQTAMLNGLLNEFPDYIKEARRKGLLTS